MKRKLLLKTISMVVVFCTLISATLLPISATENSDSDGLSNNANVSINQAVYSGGNGFSTAVTLTLNSTYNVSIDTAYEKEYFKFIPSTTGFYTFESFSNNNADPYAALYNSSQTEIEYHDDGDDLPNFCLTYHLISGATYYFTAESYSDSTGTYSVRLINTPSSNYLSTATLRLGIQSNVRITIPYIARYFSFTPSVSGEYCFMSSNATDDPQVWIYDSSMNLVNSNDDGPIPLDFKLTALLNGGNTYYIVVNNLSSGIGNFTVETYRHLSYVHYYDESFQLNSELLSFIPQASDFSDFVYKKYFDIMMYMDGNATRHETPLDYCQTGINEPCNEELCGSGCTYRHHKNILTISHQLNYEMREDDHLYVFWTNRRYGETYCYSVNGPHQTYAAIACVCYDRPVIHFLNICGDVSDQRAACMAICLIHETAHSLDMNDVYDNEGHDENGKYICAMERFEKEKAFDFCVDIAINDKSPFCASCMQTMSQLTANAVINGNQ